ncbi:DUF2255 family protein [Streptomyces sp. CRN 30]|uniref:DUF2255 family protein n=1 Tax=Streptomyces sp. CRN 30 TaxID=3075613 RepID=UPI002A7F6F58|nr:DUF2255 family protein [Streptomyces sp. CRN 30]
MTDWNESDLSGIGAAEELHLETGRADGTLRAPVTMWVVRIDNRLYVRSVKGVDGAWYRGTRSRTAGTPASSNTS